jgi:hypothetical protein
VLAEVKQRHLSREQRGGHSRAQHLPPVAEGHQAGRLVHGCAEVVAIALDDLTGVQAHADANRRLRWPRSRGQLRLCVRGRRDRITGAREGRPEPVSSGREHHPAVAGDGTADYRVMELQGGAHGVGRGVPQPRRALDVGEEESDGPRRRPHGHRLSRSYPDRSVSRRHASLARDDRPGGTAGCRSGGSNSAGSRAIRDRSARRSRMLQPAGSLRADRAGTARVCGPPMRSRCSGIAADPGRVWPHRNRRDARPPEPLGRTRRAQVLDVLDLPPGVDGP